ncbi:MAG: integrase [Thermoguttaceae bacterium]
MESTKPDKPYPEYPLFAHSNGQWAKKIRGKFHYFGVWEKPEEARDLYLEQRDDLFAGRKPSRHKGALTVNELCDLFLAHKERLLKSGDLSQRTFDRYQATAQSVGDECGWTVAVIDLRPIDFERLRAALTETWGPVALANEIQIVRMAFRYGYESELLEKPVRFGPGFAKPSAKTIRRARGANGPRMFTPDELRRIIDNATPNMKAMVLLGINGGLGNTDLGMLPCDAVKLNISWLYYPRTKTGILRLVPLWSETVAAIGEVLANRKVDSPLLFIGRRGKDYIGDHKGYRVTAEFARVAAKAKVTGRAFYDLRRTFQTIAEGCGDLPAVKAIMGQAPESGDMSAVYRQVVSDERLKAVTDHVHRWLFG